MNYYNPNSYMPYGTPQQSFNASSTPVNQTIGLNGKMVDGIEVVKATEVPLGGYGIFPKADLSEIYFKSWNNNGTTNITIFRPIPAEEAKVVDPLQAILEKIESLDVKLNGLLQTDSTPKGVEFH